MSARKQFVYDTLYGRISFDDDIQSLVSKPIVQRLRHVRLSNIDSIDLPGISNLSRFEHVLGVVHLASQTTFRARLARYDDLVLQAGALLHDWAITSFGHLVEEALQYVGTRFDHAQRLREIASGQAEEEVLAVDRQILVGRGSGLRQWIRSVTSSEHEADEFLAALASVIVGRGRFGRVISGDIDLDNIDNVFRMAYHMGLAVERNVPLRLAKAIVNIGTTGDPIFRRGAEEEIKNWKDMRAEVYEHLMLAKRDFAGKAMLIYATIRAFEEGEINKLDWSLTDFDFINRLLSSNVAETKEAAQRWIAGELWNFAPLQWIVGDRPDYVDILSFGRELSARLDRTCFAYGIKDKRNRKLTIHFDDSSTRTFGNDPTQWLLGVGSPERRSFTASETRLVVECARSYFGMAVVGPASSRPREIRESQPSLL